MIQILFLWIALTDEWQKTKQMGCFKCRVSLHLGKYGEYIIPVW